MKAKKTPAKKTPAKKTPAKKTPAKKTPAKKTSARKTSARKTSARKTPAVSGMASSRVGHGASGQSESTGPGARIQRYIEEFVWGIDSLSVSLPMLMVILQGGVGVAAGRLKRFAEKYSSGRDPAADAYSFGRRYASRAARMYREVRVAERAVRILPGNSLVALVSQFDSYVGGLVGEVLRARPGLLRESGYQFTLSELAQFESIEDARGWAIQKEVDGLLRMSHGEQLKAVAKRCGLSIDISLESCRRFLEVCERRNLFVHTGGVVSEQYLARCEELGLPTDPVAALGEKLEVSPGYFEDAHQCVCEVGVRLGQALWRKHFPDESVLADNSLNVLTLGMIQSGQLRLARALLDFGCSELRGVSEVASRVMVINRAQAYKWGGDAGRATEILESVQWGACASRFLLCVNVLLDRFDAAARIMRDIGRSGDVGEGDYDDWPVFREFRETEQFLAAYRDVFGRDYECTEKVLAAEQRLESGEFLRAIRAAGQG